MSEKFFPWGRPLKGGVAGREGRRSAARLRCCGHLVDGSGVVAERKIELIWEQKKSVRGGKRTHNDP